GPVAGAVVVSAATSGIAATPTCTVDGPPATVTGSGPYSVAVAGEGSHPVSCSVDDNAGNTNGDSDTVKIDLHAPTSPSIDSSDPVSSANNNFPKLIGTAESGSTVKLYTDCSCPSA